MGKRPEEEAYAAYASASWCFAPLCGGLSRASSRAMGTRTAPRRVMISVDGADSVFPWLHALRVIILERCIGREVSSCVRTRAGSHGPPRRELRVFQEESVNLGSRSWFFGAAVGLCVRGCDYSIIFRDAGGDLWPMYCGYGVLFC